MAYNPLNPNGQSNMAGSQPVVIASNQTPVSVAGTILVGNFPTNQNVSGSVVATQGSNPWIITGSIQGIPANQSVSGAVSISNFPSNQSVSGTVGQGAAAALASRWPIIITDGIQTVAVTATSLLTVSVDNRPSISGTVNIAGNPSISGTVNIAGNPSVSGTVLVGNLPTTQNVSGSVISFQGTVPWLIGSVYGNISGSVAATITNTNVNVGGSVVAFQAGTQSASIYGMRNDAVASFLGADLTFRPISTDSAGRTIFKPFAPDEARVQGVNSTLSTASVVVLAAAGAGLRNYITDLIIANQGAASTLVTLTDGDASILGRVFAPGANTIILRGLSTPIRTSQNKAFNLLPTTVTSIHGTALGYKAP